MGTGARGSVDPGHAAVLRVGSRGRDQAAAELAEHFDVGVELWSATSYKRLRENALEVERWNRLHPSQEPRVADVAQLLGDAPGPIVAVTDFMKIVPEQIARFLPGRTFVPLGTDGMGRSDTRESLRRFFEIDLGHVVVGVLSALHAAGQIDADQIEAAIKRYDVDPEAVDSRTSSEVSAPPTVDVDDHLSGCRRVDADRARCRQRELGRVGDR